LLCSFVAAAVAPEAADADEVYAGVAKEEFALPKGVPLAGYSRRKGAPAQGMHDPVGARALVIHDGHTTVALVSCDLLIVDEGLAEAVRQRLLARGLPHDLALILAGTHTHSGPGGYGTRFLEKLSMGHFDPSVFDAITEAITSAVVRADASRTPIRMAYETATTTGIAANRMDPAGLTDSELIVVGFYRRDHEGAPPLALLVNFGAHPTTLGAWNRQLSADYPGVIVREVEQAFPGTTCLFFAGAVGDQAPVKSGEGFERSESTGHPLAQSAIAVLAKMQLEPPHPVQAVQDTLLLPPARVRLGSWGTLPRWLGTLLVDDDATLSLVAVGNTVFLGVPCDLTAGLGQELKRAARARGLDPVVVGFANDYIGYCVPASLYERGSYEASLAFNGPTTGELIVARLIQMLDQLSGE